MEGDIKVLEITLLPINSILRYDFNEFIHYI